MHRRSPPKENHSNTQTGVYGPEFGLLYKLPQALRALAHKAVVAVDGPHPPDELGAVRRRLRSIVVLVGRATRVP